MPIVSMMGRAINSAIGPIILRVCACVHLRAFVSRVCVRKLRIQTLASCGDALPDTHVGCTLDTLGMRLEHMLEQ